MAKPHYSRSWFGVLKKTLLRKCRQHPPRHFFHQLALPRIWSWQSALLIDLPLRELQHRHQDWAHRLVVEDSSTFNGVVYAMELSVGSEVVAIRANGGEDLGQDVADVHLVQ